MSLDRVMARLSAAEGGSRAERGIHPALSAALRTVWPSEDQTWLLRACLNPGEIGARAWKECERRIPNLVALLRDESLDLRRLGPLLSVALSRHAEGRDKPLLTVVRTAYLREELRSREYGRICGAAVSELQRAGVRIIVFRGAALGELVYPTAALRHSHDINVLVEPREQAAGARALERVGFRVRPGSTPVDDALVLDHQSGLPLLLHTRFFRTDYYRLPWDDLWSRSAVAKLGHQQVHTVSPEDALLHTCCQALHRIRPWGLLWACDAHFILQRYPGLDWNLLLQVAARSRTELPLYTGLAYLAEELGAPVPDSVLARLTDAISRIEPVERDVALLAARNHRRATLRTMLREGGGWRAAMTRFRWLVLPSPSYVRWAYNVRHPLLLPAFYLKRVLRYLVRHGRQRLRRATT
jgi:hypothetical protein